MILSTAILLLILAPILASIVLSLPIVQNIIVEHASKFATEYLKAEVSMRRIDVTMSGVVNVDGFLVRDLDADTLLYVNKLRSQVVGFNPSSKRLSLGASTIDGAVMNLRQTERGEMNIREITLMMTSDEVGRTPVVIDVADVELYGMRFNIEQLTHIDPDYGVDMRNLRFTDLAAHVQNLTIDGSSLHTQVERLAAHEQSGLQIQNMSGELYITQGALAISKMGLTTQWSNLSIASLMLASNRWADYKQFEQNTDITLDISGGYLSSDDVAYFAPELMNYGVVIEDVDMQLSGSVSDLTTHITNLSYGETTHISAAAQIVGLPKFDQMRCNATIFGVTTTVEDVSSIYGSVRGLELPESIARMGGDVGRVLLRGEVSTKRGVARIGVKASAECDLGDVKCDMTLVTDGSLRVDGVVSTPSFNIGQLLRNKRLGMVTVECDVDGFVEPARRDFVSKSVVQSVDIDGYRLRNSYFTATVQGDSVDGELKIDDQNLSLMAWGSGSKGGEVARYNGELQLDLKHMNLKALGLNKRDSVAMISTKLTANVAGESLESGTLGVDIDSGEYHFNADSLVTYGMVLSASSADRDRRVELKSDFFDLKFNSESSVAQLKSYLTGVLTEYMPALYNKPYKSRKAFRERERSAGVADGAEVVEVAEGAEVTDGAELADGVQHNPLSRLLITAHNINPIAQALYPGIDVAGNSSLDFTFDDRENIFDILVKSDYVERKALLAIGIDTEITNRGDSLTMRSSFAELYVGTSQIVGANIELGAKSDNMGFKSSFSNPVDSISALLQAKLRLQRGEKQGDRPRLHAEILPSKVVQRNRVWSLDSRSIDISNGGVRIDNFEAKSQGQRMVINGVASRSESDTLKMEMRDFDLSILSTFIARLGYNMEGRTNGLIVASSALDNAKLEAQIGLDSVKVNKIVAPSMDMSVTWDSRRNRAQLMLAERSTRDTLVRGYYIPSEVKYYARCLVDSVDMALLDPPLGGVIEGSTGLAKLDLSIVGERREAQLSGDIEVDDFETTVAYTGVRYRLPQARIKATNNRLECVEAKVEDMVGGEGDLSLDVSLQHLSNISYSLRLLPRKMLVLNTEESDNDIFYGEVTASGMAQISGDRRGVRMNITASSDGVSHFYMPLSSKETVSNADFITFVQPTVADTLDALSSRRRKFEERNRGTSGSMVINMALTVNPDTEVQLVIDPTVGDIIKAKGEGQLNLTLEPQANKFEIYGDYTIEEGSYLFTLQNIVNKRFVIDPGSSIQWTGSPMDAKLNIDAIYKLKASLQPLIADESSRAVPVDCTIRLTDNLTQPDVEFAIDLPSADSETQAMFSNLLNDQESVSRQFFYLMLANSFIPESASNGADLGASAGAATGFELLTNQLSNWLSTSNYNVIIRYRPESELTGEELDVGFSKGLINNRLLVELEGNYVNENSKSTVSENASNFMGEAYITWLIDRAGALRLKGFTQTIDRFDENQGLQETGVGVYYRESFNNISDLREKFLSRFRVDEKRRAEREERRQERREKRERREARRGEELLAIKEER